MNTLDCQIARRLRITRKVRAWCWLHYQQAVDAVLMAELARAPGDAQRRAFPHQMPAATPAELARAARTDWTPLAANWNGALTARQAA